MFNLYKLWRPQLFGAVGAGFKDDPIVRDGIHLHWSFDPALGLPFEKEQKSFGRFNICFLRSKIPCLKDIDLFNRSIDPAYPLHSSMDSSGASIEDGTFEPGIRFLKKSNEAYNLTIHKFQNYIKNIKIRKRQLIRRQLDFLQYIEGLANQLKSELYPLDPRYEISEVCAIDIKFKLGTGTTVADTEEDKTNQGWLASLLSLFQDKVYLRIRAYDRNGLLLDEDWVGRKGFSISFTKFAGRSRQKFTARLRAPGIYYISFQPLAGKPQLIREETKWVFCEEYCQANIWDCADAHITRFHADKDYYTPDQVEQGIFGPFKKSVDAIEVSNKIIQHIVQQPEILQILEAPNTYEALQHEMTFNDGEADNALVTMNFPLLTNLISAGIDPVMAMILGTYYHLNAPEYNKRDFKIEGIFPFFRHVNMDALNEEIAAIAQSLGIPFEKEDHLELSGLPGFPDDHGQEARLTTLCALVLCPTISEKPAPPAPDLGSSVHTTDLPDKEDAEKAKLFVDSKLSFPVAEYLLEPYQVPVAYEVERNISDTGFFNVIKKEETGPADLDDLGLLPPVYIPEQKEEEEMITLKDIFTVPAVPDQTVQYRAKAFDFFGRPSTPAESVLHDLPVPCYASPPPTNVSAQIVEEDSVLMIELHFSLSNVARPLHALPRHLEIAVHHLPVEAEEPAELVRWDGTIPARLISMAYNSEGTDLSLGEMTISCQALSWAGELLERNTVPETVCNSEFPPGSILLEPFETAFEDDIELVINTYRVLVPVAIPSALSPAEHRWCARLRIKGLCPVGTDKYSLEFCIGASFNVPPPVPEVEQPPFIRIPVSTYPDSLGNAYYNIDLASFLPATQLANRPLLNIYKIDLERLSPDISTIVDGEFIIPGGQPLLFELAKASRVGFEKVNGQPVEFREENQFFSVKIDGDLEKYYVLGIIGCNTFQDEKPWNSAAILLFKTPVPIEIPLLNFRSTEPFVEGGKSHIRMVWDTRFNQAVDADLPAPKIQIVRTDLSIDSTRFVAEVPGITSGDDRHFVFDWIDEAVLEWHSYRYEATLMLHSERHNLFLKAPQSSGFVVTAIWTGTGNPFANSGDLNILNIPEGVKISLDFAAGEFDFSLSKLLDDGTKLRQSGKVVNGFVTGTTNFILEIDKPASLYKFTIIDPDEQEGTYTLRLSFGQVMTWATKSVRYE